MIVKRITGGFILGSILTLAACAPQQPSPPSYPMAPVVVQAPRPKGPTGAQMLAQQSSYVRDAIAQHLRGRAEWPVYKTADTITYPYVDGSEVRVNCAPLRITDIALEPGETITDIAIGDSQRFMTSIASSGNPRQPTSHLVIKPEIPGIATSLAIYTTAHIYRLDLHSRGHAVRAVQFYYPEEVLAQMAAADKAQTDTSTPTDSALPAGDPATFDFNYTISDSNVPWRPVRVFSDETHVYLQMPATMSHAAAPALLIDTGSGPEMVNYRVRGSYYTTDRLFDKAELVSGAGRNQDRVTISYTGGSH